MTGAYLRVKRNGTWVNLEVEHLTVEERKNLLAGRSEDELLRWLDVVCKALSDLEKSTLE